LKILWVKSNLIGSRLIRWGLGIDCSHVALWFEDVRLIYHSYGKGMHEVDPTEFFKINTTVHSIDLTCDEFAIYSEFSAAVVDIEYDYSALAYLAWRGSLKKFLGVPFPQKNLLQHDSKYLCTEALYAFFEIYAKHTGEVILLQSQLAINSPCEVYRYLKTVL
jgi:hypothetical protein